MLWTMPVMRSFLVLVSLTRCMQHTAAPPGLDVSLTRTTVQDRYVVTLRPLADPIRVNQMHAWELTLRSR